MQVFAWVKIGVVGVTSFVFSGTLVGSGLDYVSGVTDLEIVWTGGAAYLYSTTGFGGGATAFSIALDGTTQVVHQTAFDYSLMSSSTAQIEIVEHDGLTKFVAFGHHDWLLDGYTVNANGTLTTPTQFDWGTGGEGNLSGFHSLSIDGTTHVFGASAWGSGFKHYEITGDSVFTLQTDLTTSSGQNKADIVAFESLVIDGATVLLAASTHIDGLKSYTLGTDGKPVEANALSSAQALPISSPTAMATGFVGDKAFVVVAGAGSSSLTVLEVDGLGNLDPVDHVIDNKWTRFSKVTEVETVQVGDQLFVIAGGADDGLSLFTLMPDGSLVHLDTIADTNNTALQNIASLEATYLNGKIQIYATSETEAGITQFEVDPGSIGQNIVGTNTADTLTGGTANDLIEGGMGNDTLIGGAGDDILRDGTGQDQLTGGAGADVFALVADNAADTITDFQAGVDTLDLSGYYMLYDARQMTVQTRSWGAEVTYRNEVIYVHSAGGGPLTASHFSTEGTLSLDRPPNGFQFIPEVVNGTNGNDVLVGDEGTDTLNGLDGDDIMSWSEGADIFNGGAGTDCVSYAGASLGAVVNLESGHADGAAVGDQFDDIENLVGSDHKDVLIGDAGANVIEGGLDKDRLEGGDGDDHLLGGDGNDTLVGGAGADILDGGENRDTVGYFDATQGVEVSLLTGMTAGGAAGDTLIGIEMLEGSYHDDTLEGDNSNNKLSGNSGDDTLHGLNGHDDLFGGDGDDHLDGGTGNDTLFGGGGNDVLIAGDGSDYLDGGDGFDWVDYRASTAQVTVNLLTGQGSDAAAGDTFVSIENIYGSQYSDTLQGDASDNRIIGMEGDDLLFGGAGNDTLEGGAGGDTLDGGEGWDWVDYRNSGGPIILDLQSGRSDGAALGDTLISVENLVGSLGSDFILADEANNRILGQSGNDVIAGRHGHDRVEGGSGNDRLYGNDGNDILIGGSGRDKLSGGAGFDIASYEDMSRSVGVNLARNKHWAGAAGDRLYSIEGVKGGSGSDALLGNRRANWLSGEAGNDRLKGQSGHDKLYGGSGSDRLYGGNGNDRLYGGSGSDRLDGGKGSDRLYGGTASDRLNGGNGNDRLYGGSGNEVIRGGRGRDVLSGDAGNDLMIGGQGADTFLFSDGRDRIKDFNTRSDTLLFSSDLWGGGAMSVRKIMSYAKIQKGNAVFDFGHGDKIIVENVSSLSDIRDDIGWY